MSSRSSRGSTPIDGGPSQASEAAEEALLGEIDSLQKRQTMLETRIAQFALEQFNLKGKASSSTLKDLAAQLATAQTEEIEVSATLAQKRKDLVALLKLRRAPSGTRHSASVAPGILSASAPQVEAHRADTTSPSPLSTSNRESTRRRGTQVTPSDPLDVANSAARQRLLKRQSFPTPPSASEQPLNVSQERALAMKINEKAARRDERRRRTKEEPGSPTSHALERTSHVPSSSGRHHKSPSSSGQNLLSTSNPAITSAPLQASNSGGATGASSVAPSHALSDSGKRLSSAASAAPSGGDDLVLPAKTGYQDVLSEEETPTRVDMYPELTKAIQGIEVQYSNLRFGQPIGTGCYGEVFAATLDGKPVAVKVMTTSSTPSLRKAFVREVEALRMLRDHPNIVRLVGASLYPHWCIVMQLAHGGSLHDLLYTRRVSLTLEQALRIGRDVADALRYLHGLKTPIIHRDVTSRNVLLNAVGGSIPSPLPGGARQVDSAVQYQALLSDFGIARTKKGSRSADQLSPTGPRRFRAPEVTHKGPDGRYHYSRRVDVYMFGTVLFELLYAREPWPQDLPDERIVQQRISGLLPPLPEMTASGQAVPLELRSVISATWNEEPKLRPNIGAVSKLLELLYRRVRPSSRKGTNSATPEP